MVPTSAISQRLSGRMSLRTVPSSNRTAAVLAEMVRMAEPIVTLKANLISSIPAQWISDRSDHWGSCYAEDGALQS